MSEEKSSLVEEVEETTSTSETTENKDSFNPLAFTSDSPTGDLGPDVPVNEGEEKSSNVETNEEDGWGWNKKTEDPSEEETEENYEWEVNNNPEENIDWEKVSKQLGLEGASKNEIKSALDAMKGDEQSSEPTSPQIETLENYLTYSNKELVIEELKADGLSNDEIDDSIDKMQRNGMIAIKGREIKRTIKNAVKQQKNALYNQQQENVAQRDKIVREAREGLQGHLKDMDRFMGGKVTKKQKEEVYRFATKDMAKELWSSHANVADVAMFLLYKDQIKDILRSQGRNEGSKSLMDKIQSPSLNSGKNHNPYQPKGTAFDPKTFMSE